MFGIEDIKKQFKKIAPDGNNKRVRLLSFFSAVIAKGDFDITKSILLELKGLKVDKLAIYETVLQSYLFLGFPRMIEAALAFNELYGDFEEVTDFKMISREESQRWFEDGKELCRKVYGKNYNKLEKRFLSMAPDLFRWMVIEGYGKVLTRPGMTQVERELAEVAALIVDRRERQLISHVKGSLNVGAEMSLLRQVNSDIRPIAGEPACGMASDVMDRIEQSYETQK